MSTTSKQDRQGSRTPADLERKYDLGSMGDRFGEIMGIALDAQTHFEAAMDAVEQTNGVVAELSQKVDEISISVKDFDSGMVTELSTRVDAFSVYVTQLGTQVNSAEFMIGVINGQSTAKISADKLDIAGKKLNIKVDATNIEGTLKIGQLPPSVVDNASLQVLLPYLGYQTETGVTSIVNGIVTTDYVNALGITVNAANITGKLTADQIDANSLTINKDKFTLNTDGSVEAKDIKLRNESGYFFVDIDAGIITVAGKQIFVQETVNDFPLINFKAGNHYYAVCVRCSFDKHPDGTYDWIPWQFVFKKSDYQSL